MPKKKPARPAKKATIKARERKSPHLPRPSQPAADAPAPAPAIQPGTPKPVLETLFPKGASIGGRKVIPLTIASHCFLEELGNPAMQPGGCDALSNRQLMELCFVLTHPLAELVEMRDEWIQGDDRSQWNRQIMLACDSIPLEDMTRVGQVIGAVIVQATQTIVPTQPKKKAES